MDPVQVRAWGRRLFCDAGISLSLLAISAASFAQGPDAGARNARNLVMDLLHEDRSRAPGESEFQLPMGFYVRPDSEAHGPPEDSASLYVLSRYWKDRFTQDPDRLPMALRERLVDAAEAYPDWAADLAHLFPRTDDTDRRLFALLDSVHDVGTGDPRQKIIRYLSRNGRYFRSLLLENARAAHEGDGFVENDEDLRALARLDWADASPLLTRFALQKRPRMRALVLGLQYEHAAQFDPHAAVRLREQLKSIARDRSQSGSARDFAIDSLMRTEWPDRDDWFLSLFKDDTLASLTDDYRLLCPLEEPGHREPDEWIPRIAPLAQSPNPAVRLNAIYVLVSFQQEEARADAEIPLIPWLFDPKWVKVRDSGHDRYNLIYSLYLVSVSESASGLLHVLEAPDEDEMFEAEYAARAIARLHDERVAPVLRRLLQYPLERDARLEVAKALLDSGTMALDEKVRAVAAAAKLLTTRQGLKSLNDAQLDGDGNRIDADVILGLAVIQKEGWQRPLITAVREYSRRIRQGAPAEADALDILQAILPDNTRDGQLLQAIRRGTVTAEEVLGAIERRVWLRKSKREDLTQLSLGAGPAAAIATVLLQDEERESQILSCDDVEAQATLLAVLRFAGDMVSPQLVERFVGASDPTLAEAAKQYAELLWKWQHTL